MQVSPHTRGWTQGKGEAPEQCPGFPAHAGMDLDTVQERIDAIGFPRTRGDGPLCAREAAHRAVVSPHTRGWTLEAAGDRRVTPGFPAHAGMDRSLGSRCFPGLGFPRTRGDGPGTAPSESTLAPVSPHTRGWTHATPRRAGGLIGFPAHAGMDPGRDLTDRQSSGFPRTRGDGPSHGNGCLRQGRVSPHTRGWTPCRT